MKTLINIKADKEVKEEAQKIAGELGLSLSAVMNAYLRQFIRSREVYFSTDPHMSPKLEKTIAQVEKDIKAGKNMSPVFRNAKDAIAYLKLKS